MRHNQQGFTLIEVGLIIVVMGIMGLVVWRVWEANVDIQTADGSVVPTARIRNEADLDKSVTALDNTDIVSDSEQQLDAETNF